MWKRKFIFLYRYNDSYIAKKQLWIEAAKMNSWLLFFISDWVIASFFSARLFSGSLEQLTGLSHNSLAYVLITETL